jgi:arsenical pump membrane protein
LRGGFTVPTGSPPCLTAGGRLAGICAALAALLLVAANAFGLPVGVATLGLALVSLAIVTLADHSALRRDVRGVNYGIVPLVAGLFVLVQGLDRSGAIGATHALLVSATGWGVPGGPLGLGILITLACNLFNNLPVGLVAGLSLGGSEVTPVIRHAALIAVDLGPNLALSGSLATLIWRDALAADDLEMDAGRFLRVGAVVLPPALLLTLLVLR